MRSIFKRYVVRVITVLTLIGGATSCTDKGEVNKVIRLAHGLDINHPVHLALKHFQAELLELSAGQLNVQIFPAGQLGTEREIIELIQFGTLGMTKVSASSLEAFVPKMKVFGLPYLFTDQEHYWQILNGPIGESLLAEGERFRIKGLGYFDAGSRSFYATSAKVEAPNDLAGLKIRVMNSQSAVNMVNTMGGAATPVSWGELYTALQQGVVDGAENNPPSFFYSKHYEVSQYYVLDEHTSIPDVIIIGTHLWQQLNAAQKSWVQQAMKSATEFQRQLWQESTEMALREVKKHGVNVIIPDKAPFRASVKKLYQDITNPEISSLVTAIQREVVAK
ncbi:TRAP transporter substrate-binding protein [Psychrosphaera sp. B3R10]|uniref:TRAP transporter substrate-binding protein n=1 Tax=unclassified Psychrosphaera TaxID=2641570 RepID=UPI001C080960|nr:MULTISPECIES: TRAP transporter substrate-binding protein [unclassified Psychrosphaera]MBU2881039.1 TRAP transporter substrate-binding protein [Psychrosphaera sp. I2R16]MBU2989963.1 TRAP transporter substrate-binding protein [Psychrosphaera sp. B3R10]MDO6719146.1 TRAP transporter substrate-binding protein [Psychrosphaera sp. 1_MG-2023]